MKRDRVFEDFAVRVMYFFNTIDTFAPLSAAAVLVLLHGEKLMWLSPLAYLFAVFLAKLADYHPAYFPAIVAAAAAAVIWLGVGGGELLGIGLLLLAVTSAVQIVFMGIPMAVAGRDPLIPARMWLSSLITLAPTTMSLPVTIMFQLFIVLVTLPAGLDNSPAGLAALGGFLLAAALLARTVRRCAYQPVVFHPVAAAARYRRVILLNIDGLSQLAFAAAAPAGLGALARASTTAPRGARTVYRALTNPAFASILTGAPPAVHGVVSNNLGQRIGVEALPDYIPARLYGSMHMQHIAKPHWSVQTVSLVADGCRGADAALLAGLRADLRQDDRTRLWIADLSMVDFCGHAYGGYSRRYREAICTLDSMLTEFLHWLRDSGLATGSMVIVTSDHGLWNGDHSFLLSPREEFVPLIFNGPGILPGTIAGEASILDLAANIAYALGERYPAASGGRVFPELMAPADERR